MNFDNPNLKDLLLKHQDLLNAKVDEMKQIKSPQDYFDWAMRNKDYISKLIQLNATIFYFFEHDITKFTVDEDTFELATDFIKSFISQIDKVIKEEGTPLILSPSEEIDGDEGKVVVEVGSESKKLEEVKKKYESYLEKLGDNLPKC